MRPILLLALLLCGCAQTTAPVAPPVAVPAVRDTMIRVTARTASMWVLHLDSATGGPQTIWYIGAAAPFDTIRVAGFADTTRIVYGVRLAANGFPVCHDWHRASRGDVVTLNCQPYIAP